MVLFSLTGAGLSTTLSALVVGLRGKPYLLHNMKSPIK